MFQATVTSETTIEIKVSRADMLQLVKQWREDNAMSGERDTFPEFLAYAMEQGIEASPWTPKLQGERR